MPAISTAVKKTTGFVGMNDSIIMVDPKKILLNRQNPRKVFGNTKEDKALKEHLRHGGTVPPLLVWVNEEGEFEVVDGDRRLTAYLALIKEGVKFASVKAEITTEADPAKRMAMSLNRNQGKSLTWVEQAEGYALMREGGMSVKDIALSISKTSQNVSQMLRLAEATDEIKKRVTAGELKEGPREEWLTIDDAISIVIEAEREQEENPEEDEPEEEDDTPTPATKTNSSKGTVGTSAKSGKGKKQEKLMNKKLAAKKQAATAKKAASTVGKTAKDEDGEKLDADQKKLVEMLVKYDVDGLLTKAGQAATLYAKVVDAKSRGKWVAKAGLLTELAESLA